MCGIFNLLSALKKEQKQGRRKPLEGVPETRVPRPWCFSGTAPKLSWERAAFGPCTSHRVGAMRRAVLSRTAHPSPLTVAIRWVVKGCVFERGQIRALVVPGVLVRGCFVSTVWCWKGQWVQPGAALDESIVQESKIRVASHMQPASSQSTA